MMIPVVTYKELESICVNGIAHKVPKLSVHLHSGFFNDIVHGQSLIISDRRKLDNRIYVSFCSNQKSHKTAGELFSNTLFIQKFDQRAGVYTRLCQAQEVDNALYVIFTISREFSQTRSNYYKEILQFIGNNT